MTAVGIDPYDMGNGNMSDNVANLTTILASEH